MSRLEKRNCRRRHILEVARPLIAMRGFTAVGLSQILEAAHIPKGSFYHYFESKEHFGAALLEIYNEDYLRKMDLLLQKNDYTGFEKLFAYCQCWLDAHESGHLGEKCLVVKLAAEVADLSERMRGILEKGTSDVILRLENMVVQGQKDGSIVDELPASVIAFSVYQTWLGATLMVKVTRDVTPFEKALEITRKLSTSVR